MGRPKILNGKVTQINVRLDENRLAKLQEWADHYDEDMSNTMRRLIDALPIDKPQKIVIPPPVLSL